MDDEKWLEQYIAREEIATARRIAQDKRDIAAGGWRKRLAYFRGNLRTVAKYKRRGEWNAVFTELKWAVWDFITGE